MKLRNKLMAGFAATVLALSMMVGSAMASTDVLPFEYPNEANAATNNDVWVVLFGGTAATPLTDDEAVRDAVKTVDIVITGNASFDAELIANFAGGWVPTTMAGQTVDGELVLSLPYVVKGSGYAEVIVNLKNKTEGPLAVARMDFKDADGKVLVTHGGAAEAAAEESVPKTGVVSTALLLGLGAVAFGTGAVALKKKER
ncbi:hypothetical protein I5677_10195 [Mobilitalea sibirica]|uniref:LPXTG-motif cell wall-anchored protein n=1 Tax=Mobilitalea sibirica TaxID=1462919 RepID=A0A8J7H2X2_9FIRM|nr:hypothetical protein [Mobilitalea sibirica]MBH1941263.1 hypothetical protein [Mobilitalea sibirica]